MSTQPPLVGASIGLHLFAAGAVTMQPSWWPMALATVVADHAVLTAAGLWPTSTWLGPNLRHLPARAVARGEIALTIDDGPDPDVTPAVLDALDASNLKATFFCIGTRVLAHPALARAIVARGHALENHSHTHSHRFSVMTPWGYEREVGTAQRAIADTTGIEPRFFRAPAGLRNVFLQGVLARHGLQLTTWTRRGYDTVKIDVAYVTRRIAEPLVAGDIALLHDGHAARTASSRPVILEVLPAIARTLAQRGLTAVTLREGTA